MFAILFYPKAIANASAFASDPAPPPVTATTFSGAISGTVAAGSTGVTQSQGDNSTKLATTAYVDTAVSGGGSTSDASALAFAIALG